MLILYLKRQLFVELFLVIFGDAVHLGSLPGVHFIHIASFHVDLPRPSNLVKSQSQEKD